MFTVSSMTYFKENFGLHIHGQRVEPETPKASRGEKWGYLPLQPTSGVWERRKLHHTILLLSKRVRTPFVATFVEN